MAAGDGTEGVREREEHETERERGRDHARGRTRPGELEPERQRGGTDREDHEQCGAEELREQTTTEPSVHMASLPGEARPLDERTAFTREYDTEFSGPV